MGTKSAKLDIYWNLHKDCWSVLDRRQGRVILHRHNLIAEDVQFVVQPAGRQKVLRTGRKNVHAFVRASSIVLADHPNYDPQAVRVKYNPYKFETFMFEDEDGLFYKNAVKASVVFMNLDGKCYAK